MKKTAKKLLLLSSLFTFSITGLGGNTEAAVISNSNYMYSVENGDTLYLIAQKHGITIGDILWYNYLPNPNQINIGQQFFIPAPWLIKADKVMGEGYKYIGKPYQYGAPVGETSRFDCSSYTQFIYGLEGIPLPRDSRSQAQEGTYINKEQLRKGDLVFFYTEDRKYSTGLERIGHVAMYLGNDKLLHATTSKGVTVTDFQANSYWRSHYITSRRVIN